MKVLNVLLLALDYINDRFFFAYVFFWSLLGLNSKELFRLSFVLDREKGFAAPKDVFGFLKVGADGVPRCCISIASACARLESFSASELELSASGDFRFLP